MEQIRNEYLSVAINNTGAELWSVQDKDGSEYLWQGDARYWDGKAINLFPYIARLTEGKYVFNGATYEMDIHGFAKNTIFQTVNKSESTVTFRMRDTAETYEQYPFKFVFEISYRLVKNAIVVTYLVENKDAKTMYFGLGGHPGFNVPLEAGLGFEDYYLEFEEKKTPKRVRFSDDHYVLPETDVFKLKDDRCLPLKHSMFDDDAIVLTDMAQSVLLKSDKGNKGIRVSYPDMKYLGIWHCMFEEAPYICIAPWSSLPSRKSVIEDLAVQPDLIALDTQEKYENSFRIELVLNQL